MLSTGAAAADLRYRPEPRRYRPKAPSTGPGYRPELGVIDLRLHPPAPDIDRSSALSTGARDSRRPISTGPPRYRPGLGSRDTRYRPEPRRYRPELRSETPDIDRSPAAIDRSWDPRHPISTGAEIRDTRYRPEPRRYRPELGVRDARYRPEPRRYRPELDPETPDIDRSSRYDVRGVERRACRSEDRRSQPYASSPRSALRCRPEAGAPKRHRYATMLWAERVRRRSITPPAPSMRSVSSRIVINSR